MTLFSITVRSSEFVFVSKTNKCKFVSRPGRACLSADRCPETSGCIETKSGRKTKNNTAYSYKNCYFSGVNSDVLQTPIDYLKGVGPNRADLLRKELRIRTFQDLMHLFPNRYIDRTRYYKISEMQQSNAEVQIVGKIVHIKTVTQKRGKRLVATFTDGTGQMELVWFRGHRWIKESIKVNVPYVIFGKANWFNGQFSMPHPDMELLEEHEKNLRVAMQPIYPSTEKLNSSGITNRVIIKLIQQLFTECNFRFAESLSEELITSLKLISKSEALQIGRASCRERVYLAV